MYVGGISSLIVCAAVHDGKSKHVFGCDALHHSNQVKVWATLQLLYTAPDMPGCGNQQVLFEVVVMSVYA